MDVLAYVLAKKYVDSKIGSIEASSTVANREVVTTLPEKGEEGTVYLIPTEDGKYAEYVWKDGAFLKTKETEVESVVFEGYFKDGKFYKDETYTEELKTTLDNIYVDKTNGGLYYYDTVAKSYKAVVSDATAANAGVVKMYDTVGENTDGTMSQKAIKETIEEKINAILLLDGGSAD